MLFSKQISGFQAQVADLTGQLNAAKGNVAALESEKAKLEARVAELEAVQTDAVPKAEHDAALQLKADEITQLTEKLGKAESGVKEKIEHGIVEGIASAGVPAVRRDPKAVDNPTQTVPAKGEAPRKRLAALTKVQGD